MTKRYYTRREFLKISGTVLSSGLIAACGGGGAIKPAPPVTPPVTPPVAPDDTVNILPQDKALVFIMLSGGNDSFNMLVPSSIKEFEEYKVSRSNLALNKEDLLPLDGYADNSGKTFSLHPALNNAQTLFKRKKLSFIANCGPLVEPTTKEKYLSNSANLPIGLLSHADQIRHWQTANSGTRTKYGWLGRYADVLQSHKADTQIPMNISLSGNNIAQNGQDTFSYAVTREGSSGLIVKENDASFSADQKALNKALLDGFNTILNKNYADHFKQTYVDMTRHAQTHHETFEGATKDITLATSFSDTDLSQQLKVVAQSIAASEQLGTQQQTFFVEYLGWDHHDELLNNHQRMLSVVDNALSEFDAALTELDISDKVVTFTGSDFGRTLTSNGNGTDHGWGGNIMVMGDAVDGGKIFGQYPSLRLDSDLDVGGGLLIPTTSTDEIFAELSLWFGVDKEDLPKLFPNLPRFYDVTNTGNPIGFIS